MTPQGSAGVTLPSEFWNQLFQAFSLVKCNITDISLLLGNIPERSSLGSLSMASGNITFQGYYITQLCQLELESFLLIY